MKKKHILIIGILILTSIIFGGCSDKDSERESASVTGSAVYTELVTEVEENVLPDGIYMAEFNTDSSMFRVNEAHDGKGTLTVEDGKMTIHVSLETWIMFMLHDSGSFFKIIVLLSFILMF